MHWPKRFHQVEIVDEKDKRRRKKEAKEKDAKEATQDKEKESKETETTEKEIKEKETKEKDKDKEKEKEKADKEETTATDLLGSQCAGGTLKDLKLLYSIPLKLGSHRVFWFPTPFWHFESLTLAPQRLSCSTIALDAVSAMSGVQLAPLRCIPSGRLHLQCQCRWRGSIARD